MNEFRLLNADEIEVKVKRVTQYGAELLLYKTARTDMDLLDECIGADKWECDYKEIKGNLYCGIGIHLDEGKVIWKWDCGIESREDDEGNQKKGEASDAFKRAGFKVGIGRELYTAPKIFVSAERMQLKEKNDKWRTYDTFRVEGIAYDNNRKISGVSIVNEATGKRCFVWRAGNENAH